MRPLIWILSVVAIIACVVCYSLGLRSGIKQSRLEADQRGLVVLTLAGYKAAESTNWTKVRSLLATEIVGFTRDYERRFGFPTGTNSFVGRFAEAKAIADQVEKQMVPVASGLQKSLGSNFTVEIER